MTSQVSKDSKKRKHPSLVEQLRSCIAEYESTWQLRDFEEQLQSILIKINSPRALAVSLCIRYGCASEILRLKFDANVFCDYYDRRNGFNATSPLPCNLDNANLLACSIESVQLDYLATEFLSKSEYLAEFDNGFRGPLSLDESLDKVHIEPELTAKRAFIQNEVRVRDVSRLLYYTFNEGLMSPSEHSILELIREKIKDILGTITDHVFEDYGWGPGVTQTLRIGENHTLCKLTEFPVQCYESQWQDISNMMSKDIHWLKFVAKLDVVGPACLLNTQTEVISKKGRKTVLSHFSFVTEDKLTFVPKSAKTLRAITISPTGSVSIQTAIGRYLRRRLKYNGIDLNDQTVNQVLAQKAYSEKLCTVDLSSASDSITPAMLLRLLPEDWYDLLMRHRAASYSYTEESVDETEGGTRRKITSVHQQWKYGGMGNGIVFPLQSLLYYSMAWALQESYETSGPIAVYGDDIIMCQDLYSPLKHLFSQWGFVINEKKTHYGQDALFESCGKHFYKSVDITPFYQNKTTKCMEENILFHNRVSRYNSAYYSNIFDGTLSAIKRKCKKFSHHVQQPCDFEGDSGFIVSLYSSQLTRSLGYFDRAEQTNADDHKLYVYKLWLMAARDQCGTSRPDYLLSPAVLATGTTIRQAFQKLALESSQSLKDALEKVLRVSDSSTFEPVPMYTRLDENLKRMYIVREHLVDVSRPTGRLMKLSYYRFRR